MVVKFSRSRAVAAREIGTLDDPRDPLDEFKRSIEAWLQRWRGEPVTPQRAWVLENELHALTNELGRQWLEQELNRLEPDDKKELPPRVRYRQETYRINKKTPAQVATRFGMITLRSYYYLNEDDGEPGLHPVHERLGIGAGSATPALVERVARMSVDHTQGEVRAWLRREHGLVWSNDRLRSALRGFRRTMLPLVPELQKARLLGWLQQAEQSRGRHRPVLAVGRDGIMVPMRSGGYREASTATVSVYDRDRRRLGTIYLGQMPEAQQTMLSRQLTALVTSVLQDYGGPLPRLAYITDKGSAPDDYYRQVLKKMKHPHNPKQRLPWEWVLDFYHVCCYIGKMADALFGPETKAATQWFVKMRKWLRHRPQGAANVARSASQHLGKRKMPKAQGTEFWKAYRYLRRHGRWMDYPGYRRRGLPIGSGVTEAACKTVFTQRFKRSGMRWLPESGQVILDLRTAYLSGIWEEAFAKDLESRDTPEPIWPSGANVKWGSCHGPSKDPYRFAA